MSKSDIDVGEESLVIYILCDCPPYMCSNSKLEFSHYKYNLHVFAFLLMSAKFSLFLGLILRSIERMLKMQFSMARNFTRQPLRRYDVKCLVSFSNVSAKFSLFLYIRLLKVQFHEIFYHKLLHPVLNPVLEFLNNLCGPGTE